TARFWPRTRSRPRSPTGRKKERSRLLRSRLRRSGSMAELRVNVTPKAAQQIKAQLSRRAHSKPESGVRLGVKGGGCSGMSYVIEYCDQPRQRDKVFEVDGARVYVDPKSLIYLNGTTFDYVESFQQRGFKFVN